MVRLTIRLHTPREQQPLGKEQLLVSVCVANNTRGRTSTIFASDLLAFHLPVNLNRRPASREYTRTCGSQNAVSVRLIERLAGAVNGRCREAAGIAGGFDSCIDLGEVSSIGSFVTGIHPSRYRHNATDDNFSIDRRPWRLVYLPCLQIILSHSAIHFLLCECAI